MMIVGDGIENAVRLVFHVRNGVDALFLNGYVEVVSILHFGNTKRDPHLNCTAENRTFAHLLLQKVQHGCELLPMRKRKVPIRRSLV